MTKVIDEIDVDSYVFRFHGGAVDKTQDPWMDGGSGQRHTKSARVASWSWFRGYVPVYFGTFAGIESEANCSALSVKAPNTLVF